VRRRAVDSVLHDWVAGPRYFVVDFKLSDEEIPEVTSAHLLFIIAAELSARRRSPMRGTGRMDS
jgi:hypothetical protein